MYIIVYIYIYIVCVYISKEWFPVKFPLTYVRFYLYPTNYPPLDHCGMKDPLCVDQAKSPGEIMDLSSS